MTDIQLRAYKRKEGGGVMVNGDITDAVDTKVNGDLVSGHSNPACNTLDEVSWTKDMDEKYAVVENGHTAGEDIKKDPYDDNEDEDQDAEIGSCSRAIMSIQTSVSDFYKKYGAWMWRIFGVLLAVGYFVYFGFALRYEFPSAASIQLVWMTILAVCLYIIFKFHLYTRITEACGEKPKMSAKTSRKISWAIGVILLIGITIFIIVDVVVITKKPYNLVSVSGLVFYVLITFVTSKNPARVNWRTVLWGIVLQLILALLVLRWETGFIVVNWISDRIISFIDSVNAGSEFVFGATYMDHWFVFKGMASIVFVCSVIAILFHLGAMQRITQVIGWILWNLMGTTAAESMAAAGNIFVGNTQAPVLILPMVKDMTKSELHCLMVGGFATISGGAVALYITLGAPANHLISASVMSAPAALAMAKLAYPETEKSRTRVDDLEALRISPYRNIIEAASQGAIFSVKLAVNITVNILAFIALMEFVNETLRWFGHRVGLYDPELTFGLICSYVMYPLALCMGVELQNCRKVAELLGVKTIVSTSLAYRMLGELRLNKDAFESHVASNQSYSYIGDDIMLHYADGTNTTLDNGILSSRSEAIATFSLCGFASIESIGIMMGALTAMVPERKSDLSELVVRALIIGNVASFMTACFAGLMYTGE